MSFRLGETPVLKISTGPPKPSQRVLETFVLFVCLRMCVTILYPNCNIQETIYLIIFSCFGKLAFLLCNRLAPQGWEDIRAVIGGSWGGVTIYANPPPKIHRFCHSLHMTRSTRSKDWHVDSYLLILWVVVHGP